MLDEEIRAEVELIDPFDQPGDYGGTTLLTDLHNMKSVAGNGPKISDDLVSALELGEYDRADALLSSVRDWLRKRPYTVIAEGTEDKPIPFLVVQAPECAGISVAASQEATSSHGGEFSFKVLGNGLGTNAKITVGSTTKLVAKTNEALVYSVVLPIHWERRADPRNDDINWIVTEVGAPRQTNVRSGPGEVPPGIRILDSLLIDNSKGGAEPLSLSKSYAIEAGGDFTLGFKIDSVGIDTSLKVSAAESSTTSLEANLPSGRLYEVAWLGGPWGVRVTARS